MEERLPLVGSLINRNTNPDTFANYDQQFVNCYPEVTRNQVTGSGKVVLAKRPGFGSVNSSAASYGGIGGALIWSGFSTIKAVFPYLNSTTLGVYDSNLALVGATISNISGWVFMTETTYSNKATLTMTARKSTDSLQHAYYIKEGDASWTEITDAGYPANQTSPLTTWGQMVHMDGFAFVQTTDGKIWNSELNDITNWGGVAAGGTNFVTAQSSPDIGFGIAKTKNLIVAFGAGSIEFFQNTGNATGSPLTRIASAAMKIGAAGLSAFSGTVSTWVKHYYEVGDSVYFIGSPVSENQVGVFRLTGTELTRVSNPAIDKRLAQKPSGSSYGFAGTMIMHGMLHLVMYTGSATQIPVYCIDTGVWWYLNTGNSLPIVSCVPMNESSYATMATSRKLSSTQSTSPTYQDDATNYEMAVQLGNYDHGTSKRKFYTSIEVIADTQSTSGNLDVSWSDDDYANFSTARAIDMTAQRKRLMRCGSSRRRGWKLSETVNRPFRGEAIELVFDVGSA